MVMLILRELREEANLTQKQLAEKIGNMQRNISNWEQGVSQPDLPTLIVLADFFKVSLDELCGREPTNVSSAKEIMLLRKINRLTSDQKTAITKLIDSFLPD